MFELKLRLLLVCNRRDSYYYFSSGWRHHAGCERPGRAVQHDPAQWAACAPSPETQGGGTRDDNAEQNRITCLRDLSQHVSGSSTAHPGLVGGLLQLREFLGQPSPAPRPRAPAHRHGHHVQQGRHRWRGRRGRCRAPSGNTSARFLADSLRCWIICGSEPVDGVRC